MKFLLLAVCSVVVSFMPSTAYVDVNESQCKDFVFKELPSIPGWCSKNKAEAMMDLIFAVQPEVCVELGVFAGASIFPTAYALKYLNKGRVYAIDDWTIEESVKFYENDTAHRKWWETIDLNLIHKSFLQLLKDYKLEKYCVTIKKSFEEAVDDIEQIDILHIDATHTNEGDFIHAMTYLPKVKQGGYIWFDGWLTSPDAFDYLETECEIEMIIENENCILLRKITE
jgi:hypothetical protein